MIVSTPVAASDLQVSRLQQILLRRRKTIAVVIAAALALSIASYLTTPPRYSAEAVLALDGRQLQGMPSEAVISPLPQDTPGLKTELDIIGSRLMAEKVLDHLTAAGVTLDPYHRRPSLAENIKGVVQSTITQLTGSSPMPAPAVISEDTRRQDTINMLLANLGVSNDGHSLTIFLYYTADDPQTAATVANAFANAYINHQVDVQMSAIETVRTWLGQKVDGLRHEVEMAESARTQFRQQAGLVEVDGATLQARRVAALDQELANIKGSLGGARARLQTAQGLTADSDGIAFSEVLASPTIQAFRIEQARLQRAIEDISSAGAIKSGDLPVLKSQLASINQQIADETKHVIDSLANEVAVLEGKESDLTTDLKAAQADLATSNMSLVKAAELDREATASRELYDSYLTRYKQTVEQDGITSPEAQLISAAQAGSGKIGQSLPFAILLGLAGGGLAGLAAAMLREFTDKRIRSNRQLEEATGLEILGAIQSPRRRKNGNDAPTAFERSVATLHATLRSSTNASGAQVIAITSALPREGKTLVTAALARSLAASGCTVLAFDLDLDGDGLEAALKGEAMVPLDQALRNPDFIMPIRRNGEDGEITLIACRPGRLPPEVLLDAKRFGALMERARERFDILLIDTPAMQKYGVAGQAAAQSDMTLLLVNVARTSIKDVARAALQLCGVTHGARALVTASFFRPAPFPAAGEVIDHTPTGTMTVGAQANKGRPSGALTV
ncbi:MAG TPA: exopolysaccharide transport family protein [Devosiaceae bacterium]|jgi:uncharacterized protein involved in exopolysaccharide biosynthesis